METAAAGKKKWGYVYPGKKKKQALLRLPRWSPTLVLTELDDA